MNPSWVSNWDIILTMLITDSAKINQGSYDLVAANYSEEHGEELVWQPELDKFIGLLSTPKLVVDLGCGHGDETIYLAGKLPATEVVGVDFATSMIKVATSKAGRAKFQVGDVTAFEPPVLMDGVWARATLHHLTDEELATTFGNLVEYAAPGLVLGMVNKYGDFEEIEEKPKYGQTLKRYFNYMNEGKVQRLASTYGFEVLEQYIKPEGGHKFLVSYLRRITKH